MQIGCCSHFSDTGVGSVISDSTVRILHLLERQSTVDSQATRQAALLRMLHSPARLATLWQPRRIEHATRLVDSAWNFDIY